MILHLVGTLAAATIAARPAAAGDVYEIVSDREITTNGPNDSSGIASDVDAVIERVLAVRPDGLELAYDLPRDASPGERSSQWQLPARIFRPAVGPPRLLNAAELATRLAPWLRSGGLTGAACGRLFFIWNAFRVDCDPQSAVRIVEAFDLRSPDVRDGALYANPRGTSPVRLSRTSAGPGGETYAVTVALDPEIVRRERAASDVGVGEIARRPVSLPDMLRAHAGDAISGTITVTFGADVDGQVARRIRVTRYSVTSGKGMETGTVTETLTRRRLP